MFLNTNSGEAQAFIQHRVISSGDEGIRQTCQLIRKLIDQGKSDPIVRSLARTITEGQKTQIEQSQAIVGWFMSNIHYKPDDGMSWTEQGLQQVNIHECPSKFAQCEGVEMLHTARQILTQRFGDCDDFCILLGALHELVGISTKLVVVALDRNDPTQYSHVYLIANLDGSWIPVDAVNKTKPWGWEAPHAFRKEIMC